MLEIVLFLSGLVIGYIVGRLPKESKPVTSSGHGSGDREIHRKE